MNNQFYIETEVLFNEIYSKLVNDFSVTEIGKILESHIELLELTSKGRIDPIFIKIQIGSLNDLIDLKISSTHLIASMLYYLSLSENFHENYLEKFGPSIQTIVKDLINIGLYVERNNCWLENPNIKRPESKTSQLNNVRSKRWDKQTTANLPRMFLQIAKSDQTSIVKLIERLNILQYSQFFLSQECSLILANETLTLHSPLAEQLGIWSLKWRLDDASFQIINPKAYFDIVDDLNEKRSVREAIVQHAITIIKKNLQQNQIEAEISGRAKHIYGLYLKKIKEPQKSIFEINDSLGIRIVVDTKDQCYLVLGVLFNTWKPVEGIYNGGYLRDWIENRKPNGYQSIHTTVFFSEEGNRPLEVQIRTHEMHKTAEFGPAAHWFYRQEGQTQVMSAKDQILAKELLKIRELYEIRNKITEDNK